MSSRPTELRKILYRYSPIVLLRQVVIGQPLPLVVLKVRELFGPQEKLPISMVDTRFFYRESKSEWPLLNQWAD